MQALVSLIESVEPIGNTLSQVKVGEHVIVANRKEDGSFRWAPGEYAVYVPENAIVPEDVLKERGYWQDGAKKGDLGGSKGNRVKGRTFTIDDDTKIESRGLLFKLTSETVLTRGNDVKFVSLGDDVGEFLGLTEYVPV